jgi:nucleoside-triphosphatase
LITGKPGCGKSTLVIRIVNELQKTGLRVGGISTPDFRSATGQRRGFFIRDIATGNEKVMASVDTISTIRVGRYAVDVIDEIGKMELAVPEFQQCVVSALDSTKPVLGTIGLFLQSNFVTSIKQRPDVEIITLIRDKQEEAYAKIRALIGTTN